MFSKIKLIGFLAVGAFVLYSMFGPSSSSGGDVVNLDTVLDTMVATLTELDGETADAEGTPSADTAEDAEKTNQVLGLYHTKINEAAMQSGSIGIMMQEDGAILGFNDGDADNAKTGSGEKDLFKVEIDAENSRLIATDLEHGYARDHRMPFGGLLTGYMIGRMLSGQRAAGITSSKFANTKVSPKGYHSSAKSAVRARSSGGSRSFSSGK